MAPGGALRPCGIGFGGPVNFSTQTVALSTHLGGWKDTRLAAQMEALLGGSASMDNDANAGAAGEAESGAGKGCSQLFDMTLSTGIGGGIYADGRVWRGADSWAGEIGHLTIRPGACAGRAGASSGGAAGCGWSATTASRPGNCLRIRRSCAATWWTWRWGLKTAIVLLNPHGIVIGGGIAKAGDALFVPLREELRRQITWWSGPRIDVAQAALGDDSVLYGALALAKTL